MKNQDCKVNTKEQKKVNVEKTKTTIVRELTMKTPRLVGPVCQN